MANIIQDELYKTFLQVSGQHASALADVTTTLSDVRAQVQEMGATIPTPNARTTESAPTSQANPGGDAQVTGQRASELADLPMTLSGVLAKVQEMGAGIPANAKATASPPTIQANPGGDAQILEQQAPALADATMTRSGVLEMVREIQGAIPAPNAKITASSPTSQINPDVDMKVPGQRASALADVTMPVPDVLAQAREMRGAIPAPNIKIPTSTSTSQADSDAGTRVPIQQASALSDLTMTLSDVLAQVQERQGAIPAPNVKTTTWTSTSQANSGGDILSSAASTVLKSGFGLAPLVSGLINLFGGSDTPAPAPLVKYALPAAIDFQAAQTASGTSGLDYDQSGRPRVYAAGAAGSMQTMAASGAGNTTSGAAPARQAPQITVNVQAMDARSFLDRSNEIALAVRDAMLNMNAINDVVNEL